MLKDDAVSLSPPVDPVLISWCEANGITFGPIKAGFVQQGWRGIIATEEIKLNQCILKVPSRLLLCCQSARRDAALTSAIARCQLQPSNLQASQIFLPIRPNEF